MSTREHMIDDEKPKPEEPGKPAEAMSVEAKAAPPADASGSIPATENALGDELATPPEPKKRRGFAAMDPDRVRAIARKGGVAAHERGTAHRFTKTEAREAGRKGGLAPHRSRGGPSKRAA